jgi:hypothetical protein
VKITLFLEMKQVQAICAGLLELPGKIGLPVLNEIERQVQEQSRPQDTAPAPEKEAA